MGERIWLAKISGGCRQQSIQQWKGKKVWGLTTIWGLFRGIERDETEPKRLWSEYEMLGEGV